MEERLVCDYCHEEFEGKPIRRGARVYCSEACAFEASRSTDCGGKTDIHASQPPGKLDLVGKSS
jgi:hypothetical protein